MVDVGKQGDDRHVKVHRDVLGSTIISGDGNKVFIYHYNLTQQQKQAPQPQPARLGPNPYRGLAAFQAEDADVYFGREEQIDRLWHRLRDFHEQAINQAPRIRLLPILGPSGSGKSSLARAGLLPELARQPLPAHKGTRVVVKPGSTPLEALALVLARIVTHDPSPVEKAAEFERVLKRKSDDGTYGGLKRIANALPEIDVSPLVVLVDQFEETYSLCKDAGERGAFVDNLIEAARASAARVSIIITLRTDFLGQTQQHSLLNQVIGSDQSVIVPAMSVEELRWAIAKPAGQAGHPLDNATIDLLIEQTKGREGALPMLQFALTSIWEGLGKGKPASETLREIGGVGGALANEAQQIYEQLDDQQKDIARRVFIGLVQLGEGTRDTRRRAKVANLVTAQDNPQQVQQVLGRFSSPSTRLITLSSNDGQEVAEITHEALFDHWGEFNDWLDGRRDLIRQQRQIETTAEEWNKQGKSRGYLLQGRQLSDARDFYRQHSQTLPLSPLAAELVRQSRHKRWLNRCAAVGVAIIPLLAVEAYLRDEQVRRDYRRLDSDNPAEEREAVLSLVKGCGKLRDWSRWLFPIGKRLFGNCHPLEAQDLSKAQLRRAYLGAANLISANLSHANLRDANLSGADLHRANLSHANLRDASLIHADLPRADLSGASLISANLYSANLSHAYLRDANLSGASLYSASLRGAYLGGINLNVFIGGANLSGADLSGANLRDANLRDADLSNANLEDSFYDKSTWFPENFNPANQQMLLIGPNANLRDATLSGADLRGADLRGADLRDADLSGADLSSARNLVEDQVSKAKLCKTKPPKGSKLNPDRDCKELGM